MIKIVFFAPYPRIFSDIQRAFDDRPDRDEFQYDIRQDITNNPLKNLDADIYIARGFTARSLQQTGIPCVELQVSAYDIIAAVYRCQTKSPGCRRIALIGPHNMIYGADILRGILPDITVTPYIIDNETVLDETVQRAVTDGNTAVVGSHSAALAAEKFGITSAFIESGTESLTAAISFAKEAVMIRRKEQENSARIANIMNYSFQGIISTDRSGIITMANTYVYSILKIDTSLIGKPISELFPDIPTEAVIRHGAKILSDLRTILSMKLLINCVPIIGESEITGCVLTFQNITQIQKQEDTIRKKLFQREYRAQYNFNRFIYKSAQMEELLTNAREFSYADSHVMIIGETGTGKQMLAQSIHNASRRKSRPFVSVNCAALSESALERELFGFVEGAVKGLAGEKAAAFELAHQGTLFLDNIAEMPLRLQSRLLGVLQLREITRLGSVSRIPVNVRIITAAEGSIVKKTEDGSFRKDLFYRLNVLELRVPPLRERQADIPLLTEHYLAFYQQKIGSRVELANEPAMRLLSQYAWPGNVRELENFCERLSVLCNRTTARPEDVVRVLPDLQELLSVNKPRPLQAESAEPGLTKEEDLKELLERFNGNRKKTAAYMGVDPSTLWRRMKKAGLL